MLTEGLQDLNAGVRTENALLMLVGRPRLERCGIPVPPSFRGDQGPEHELYDLLVSRLGREKGYSHYNSLIRRLVSLEHALDLLHRSRVTD